MSIGLMMHTMCDMHVFSERRATWCFCCVFCRSHVVHRAEDPPTTKRRRQGAPRRYAPAAPSGDSVSPESARGWERPAVAHPAGCGIPPAPVPAFHVRTLMLTDVQTPFLGTTLVPLQALLVLSRLGNLGGALRPARGSDAVPRAAGLTRIQ